MEREEEARSEIVAKSNLTESIHASPPLYSIDSARVATDWNARKLASRHCLLSKQ